MVADTSAVKVRRTQAYRKAAARVVAEAKRKNLPCALCHGMIDYDARPRSPRSPSADHIVSLKRGGDPTAASNLQISHLGCNSTKRAGLGYRVPLSRPSPEPAMVAVCANRACSCSWMGDGPSDSCLLGPPVMRTIALTKHGWTVQS